MYGLRVMKHLTFPSLTIGPFMCIHWAVTGSVTVNTIARKTIGMQMLFIAISLLWKMAIPITICLKCKCAPSRPHESFLKVPS
jgi:hypothetical protein